MVLRDGGLVAKRGFFRRAVRSGHGPELLMPVDLIRKVRLGVVAFSHASARFSMNLSAQ